MRTNGATKVTMSGPSFAPMDALGLELAELLGLRLDDGDTLGLAE